MAPKIQMRILDGTIRLCFTGVYISGNFICISSTSSTLFAFRAPAAAERGKLKTELRRVSQDPMEDVVEVPMEDVVEIPMADVVEVPMDKAGVEAECDAVSTGNDQERDSPASVPINVINLVEEEVGSIPIDVTRQPSWQRLPLGIVLRHRLIVLLC
jgi:hypothetical protein